MGTLVLVPVYGVASITSAAAAPAKPVPGPVVTVNFEAQVADARCGANSTAGDIITGSYTYDLRTSDTNSDDTGVGDYWHAEGYGIRVDLGTFSAQTLQTGGPGPFGPDGNFVVEIVDRPDIDNYLLRSYVNTSTGPGIDHIAWQLDDPLHRALRSDALPTTAPRLQVWKSIFGLTLDGQGDPDDPSDDCFIRAHVTKVSTVTG